MACLAGAFSLAGTSVIAARFFGEQLGIFTITGVSLFLALCIMLPLGWKELTGAYRQLRLRDGVLLFLQALFGIFLFRMFLLTGLEKTTSGEAGILTGATPAITVLLAAFVLSEPISRRALLGLVSAIGGVVLIQLFSAGKPGAMSLAHLAGNGLVLLAAISESSFNILSRRFAMKSAGSQGAAIPPMTQTTLVTAMAMFLCLIPAAFEHPLSSLRSIGWQEWLALVWYGPFVTALAFMLWYTGIKRCLASTAAAFSGLMPFTALLLSVLILGEHSYWLQWVGGGLVILGIILIAGKPQPEPKQGCAEKSRTELPGRI
ncbi:DMT family transporter [Paenibacillus oralis]|uniref:DMT family transporter n=2 Tax=Paenibacillus oralis TaxID=2490856 RepID=A0A3P3UD29_9BACL|nr:DMT family transporter [Paenibacillus oralis]